MRDLLNQAPLVTKPTPQKKPRPKPTHKAKGELLKQYRHAAALSRQGFIPCEIEPKIAGEHRRNTISGWLRGRSGLFNRSVSWTAADVKHHLENCQAREPHYRSRAGREARKQCPHGGLILWGSRPWEKRQGEKKRGND